MCKDRDAFNKGGLVKYKYIFESTLFLFERLRLSAKVKLYDLAGKIKC
jgi:hypothetical protein